MAFTYEWKVTSLKVRDQVNSEGATLPNAVVQTFWEVTGTNEDGDSGMFSGATPFSAENVPEGSFKAFADLVEADVLGWIQNVVNNDASYKKHIDGEIQKKIDIENESEIDESGLPWGDGTSATPALPSEE
jgi:hypothetical protein